MSKTIRAIGGLLIILASTLTVLSSGAPAAKAATPTDVMFLFDTSGSMAGVLEEASAEIQQVMARIDAVVPEIDYGVAEVRDYGGSGYDEEDPDLPWHLVVPITADRARVGGAISDLSAFGGGDSPEAYGRALWESDTNPFVGWRPGARHAIVLIADQVPHMPNVDSGMPEALWFEPAPWDTGEELPGSWGIEGTQIPSGQKTEFLDVLRQLAGDAKPLEMVDYHATGPNFIHYWEYWASLAGGHAVEAGSGGKELAGKLIGLIEAAAPPCATAATPTAPSPIPPSTQPTALTPRFGAPATQVTIVPAAGTRFCPGEHVTVGLAPVTSFEESTPAQMTFRVPPGATGGITVTGSNGASGPPTPYEVDNFRYPWGFNLVNQPGDGGNHTYDRDLDVTDDDLNSVFAALGAKGSPERKLAEAYARFELQNGLCYGFSVISKAVYGDSHGPQRYPLSWAASNGLVLGPKSVPYLLKETADGAHAVTHALLRAALTQRSSQAEGAWQSERSSKNLAAALAADFQAGQPTILGIHDREGGHALLAFNYQSPDPTTGEGIAVDVVDPNVPWSPKRPASDYEALQIHMRANGTWRFSGTFTGAPFGDQVGGAAGTLKVMTDPPMPGGLRIVPSRSSKGGMVIEPGGGDRISAIGYSSSAGDDIPDDAAPPDVFNDAPSEALTVPSEHRTVSVTIKAKSGGGTSSRLVGPGFIDSADVPDGESTVTVSTDSGALGAASAPAGTTLSVTSVTGEVQQVATVTFLTRVKHPEVKVGEKGGVTVTTAGGSGRVSIKLAAFAPGHVSRKPREVVPIKGRTKLNRQTPKVKHKKHKHGKKGKHKRHRS